MYRLVSNLSNSILKFHSVKTPILSNGWNQINSLKTITGTIDFSKSLTRGYTNSCRSFFGNSSSYAQLLPKLQVHSIHSNSNSNSNPIIKDASSEAISESEEPLSHPEFPNNNYREQLLAKHTSNPLNLESLKAAFNLLAEEGLLHERFLQFVEEDSYPRNDFESKALNIIPEVKENIEGANSLLKSEREKNPSFPITEYCGIEKAQENAPIVAAASIKLQNAKLLTPEIFPLILVTGKNAGEFVSELIHASKQLEISYKVASDLSEKWITKCPTYSLKTWHNVREPWGIFDERFFFNIDC